LTLELLQEQTPGSLLDVGCGSGVLSIAAAKLGFAPVAALDVDAAALEATRDNARANGVEVTTHQGDALTQPLPGADLVLANVALDVVETLLPLLDARRVVASGYLARDEVQVRGWKQLERRVAEGWAVDLLESHSSE